MSIVRADYISGASLIVAPIITTPTLIFSQVLAPNIVLQSPPYWQSFSITFDAFISRIDFFGAYLVTPDTYVFKLFSGVGIGGSLLTSTTISFSTLSAIYNIATFSTPISIQANIFYTFQIATGSLIDLIGVPIDVFTGWDFASFTNYSCNFNLYLTSPSTLVYSNILNGITNINNLDVPNINFNGNVILGVATSNNDGVPNTTTNDIYLTSNNKFFINPALALPAQSTPTAVSNTSIIYTDVTDNSLKTLINGNSTPISLSAFQEIVYAYDVTNNIVLNADVDTAMTWSTIPVNVGNVFSSNTFVSNATGIYMFGFSSLISSGVSNPLWFRVFSFGSEFHTLTLNASTDLDTLGAQFIAYVTSGDTLTFFIRSVGQSLVASVEGSHLHNQGRELHIFRLA